MLKLRRLHLYLGVFFAPMLLFFILTGWYQTAYPDRRKSVFEASAVMDGRYGPDSYDMRKSGTYTITLRVRSSLRLRHRAF